MECSPGRRISPPKDLPGKGFVTVRHRCFRPAMDETRLRGSAFAEGAGAFRPLKSRPGWGGLQARASFSSSRVLLNLHSCFLLGHDFSRALNAGPRQWALAPATSVFFELTLAAAKAGTLCWLLSARLKSCPVTRRVEICVFSDLYALFPTYPSAIARFSAAWLPIPS